MSRGRKRRAGSASNQPNRVTNKWKWLLVIPVILLLGGAVASSLVKRFLHSDGLRQRVENKVSSEIGAPLVMSDLRWSGLHLKSDGFTAASEGALQHVEATNMELDIDTDYWAREVWDLTNVEFETATVKLDLRKEFTTLEVPEEPESWLSDWMPKEVKLHNAQVHHAAAEIVTDDGVYAIERAHVQLQKEDYGYSVELDHGDISLPYTTFRKASLAHARMRLIDQSLVVDEVKLSVLNGAEIHLVGEVDTYSREYAFNGILRDLRCQDVVDEDWKQRLQGDVEAEFSVQPNAISEPEISGDIVIKDGSLTALPVLDTIASYTGVSDFKYLQFSDFQCKLYKHKDLIRLTNISVKSGGLMRLEGDLDIKGSALDGKFRLGLHPSALKNIPGAEDRVFYRGEHGMSWATITIGGTTDAVEEDITARLKAAALARMIEIFTENGALKFGQAAVDQVEDINQEQTLETARDIGGKLLEGGLDALDSGLLKEPTKAGSGLIEAGLNGFLGSSKRKKQDSPE